MSLPTKLWIDLNGNSISVGDDLSHEDWANQHGQELEHLLDAGWCRIQNVPPPYLYLDFRLPLNAAQAVAVRKLFDDRFEQIVVEFASVAKSFMDRDEAMKYALSRCCYYEG